MSRGQVTFISVLYRARNSPRQTNPFPPSFSHTSLQDYFWTRVFDHLGGDNLGSFSNQATKDELGNPTKFCESKPPSNSHVCWCFFLCIVCARALCLFLCWQLTKKKQHKTGTPPKMWDWNWLVLSEWARNGFIFNLKWWASEQVIGVEHWSLTSWFLEQRARSTFLYSRWWFQTWFIFTPIWGRFPIWLISFKWVETTNQLYSLIWSINFTTSPTSTCFHDDLVKGFSSKSDLP